MIGDRTDNTISLFKASFVGIKKTPTGTKATFTSHKGREQKDGSSCGLFAVRNAALLTRREWDGFQSLSFFQQKDVAAQRIVLGLLSFLDMGRKLREHFWNGRCGKIVRELVGTAPSTVQKCVHGRNR